jgi:hypothetical protein
MKRISVILIIGLVLVACGEQTEPLKPLDKGTPNTVKLSNGEVVYKLDGEWSCVFQPSMGDDAEDIIKISQDGNTFVGIYINGNIYKSPGDGAIKGELEKNGFKSVYVNAATIHSFEAKGWEPATGKISENCNKIITNVKVGGLNQKLTLNRK